MKELFESLAKNVSEACYNDIMGIVEEVINELKDSTIGSAYNKRLENYKKALSAAVDNPEDRDTLKAYAKASNKLANNSKLSYNAFTRSGNTKAAETVSPERKARETDQYKKAYDTAREKANKIIDTHNELLHQDRARGVGAMLMGAGQLADLKSDAEEARKKAEEARKTYHNAMDYNNTVPRNKEYLIQHLKYQKDRNEGGPSKK